MAQGAGFYLGLGTCFHASSVPACTCFCSCLMTRQGLVLACEGVVSTCHGRTLRKCVRCEAPFHRGQLQASSAGGYKISAMAAYNGTSDLEDLLLLIRNRF